MILILGPLLGYLILLPIIWRLLFVAHTKLVNERKMKKMPRGANRKAMPTPLHPKAKERLRFARKDQRTVSLRKKQLPIKNLHLYWGLFIVGLLLTVGGAAASQPILILFGIMLYFIHKSFGIISAHKIITQRQAQILKIAQISRSTLNHSGEIEEQPSAYIQVQWKPDDPVKPNQVQVTVPTTFNAAGEENFMRQFNQVFGTESAWVPHVDPEKEIFGWDYDKGTVTIKETLPLPQSASWDEHYVLDPSVVWSFFPIALGTENGIEVTNPKTGAVENVLGFDVSGLQLDHSKKMGTYCSPTIVTSPMALAGGGTGGGKSLSLDTVVEIIEKSL